MSAPLEPDLQLAFEQVENSWLKLKQRYTQIQKDRAEYDRARDKQRQLKRLEQNERGESIKTELNLLQQQIEQLELNLESRLLNWEPFWQAVRFGGLGVVIGWLLKTWAS